MAESWAPIDGFDGYEVSTLGRVRSVKFTRIVYMRGSRNKNYPYHAMQLRACTGAKPVRRYVHRLVATAFLPNEAGLPLVNHKDFDVTNNAVDNLEWVSHAGNTEHSGRAGRLYGNTGRLTEADAVEVIKARATGLLYREVGERFGISADHACNICNGHRFSRVRLSGALA